MLEMLEFAAKIALPTNFEFDKRSFWLGCVGIRRDGALVFSRNGATYSTIMEDYQLIPEAHAECRALKKMDYGGELYVARVRRRDRDIALSMPCGMCSIKIKSKGIKRVYYTINNSQYGIWYIKDDKHIVRSM